jgi:hypothetical protein
MNVRGIFCLVLIVSALVLFAGCTGQQPAVQPSPAKTATGVSTTPVPTISEKPATTVPTVVQAADPRLLLVNKPWKVQSWRTDPEMDLQNTSVKAFLANYHTRANDTYTWYDNGTLVYRYANGTAYTTGTWNLTDNNRVIVEKYTNTDGFYLESQNEILNISKSIFVIRYPASVAGKEYFFIETHSL